MKSSPLQRFGEPLTDSCYVSMFPTKSSVYRLLNWLDSSGEPQLQRDNLADLYTAAHVTVVYSKKSGPDPTKLVGGIPQTLTHFQYNVPITGTIVEFEEWPGHDGDGYLVAKLESEQLHAIHKKWVDAGCKHSFPDYEPHITIATPYDPGSTDVEALNERVKRVPIVIEFVNETAVPIKKKEESSASVPLTQFKVERYSRGTHVLPKKSSSSAVRMMLAACEDTIHDYHMITYVATVGNSDLIVGAVSFSITRPGTAVIHHLGSIEKGAGTVLMTRVKTALSVMRVKTVTLEPSVNTGTKDFYTKLGFKDVPGSNFMECEL